MKELSTVYADIVKVETKPDEPNFRYVHARISDETKDLDGQTADYDWLKSALPDWFKWGNVRDMHENNVVGKGKELTDLGAAVRGFDGVLKVVDPVAVIKVDEGLFTGVSVGIKGPRVINNKGANVHPTQPGRIVGGKIVEVSLVDHPCNESCKLTVLKDAAAAGLILVKGAKLEKLARVDILKDGALYWYKRAKWNAAARRDAEAAGHAEAGGRFPIEDASDVSDAAHLINTGHGDSADRAHVVAQAKRLGIGNPFKKKNQGKLAEPQVTPADLDAYKSRFHSAFANAGVALSDGSYLIMDEGDLVLAKALHLTGFGNVTAADLLIKRRESELTKSHLAPGARDHRDSPGSDTAPEARRDAADNPDKPTIAHESPAASGSAAAFADEDHAEGGHPPTKAKKKKGMSGSKNEPDPHTHGADTGAQGTQTDSGKATKVKQSTKTKTKTQWMKKNAASDPADWSDKKLVKAIKIYKSADPDGYKAATNSYSGDGRPLLEQIARAMQGRIYDAAGAAQGPVSADTKIDKPENAPGSGLLNDGGLIRDGDPRIGANTPAAALAQGGPMSGGNATTSPGGDSGVPNTALPFGTAPQAGSSPTRMAPGSLPGTLRAPGDANPVQHTSGASGGGGEASAAPPMRAASPAAQAGPDPNSGGTRTAGSPNTAFASPSGARKAAKADKKKRKKAKAINKLAKAAVADHIEAAIPDSVKAAIAGLLKKFEKDLEKNVLAKYATADQIKALQEDVDRLGKMPMPGGPFVGQISSVEKVVSANHFAQPETQVVGPDVMEQIERFDRLSKSDNRELARSAQAEVKKLMEVHFPKEIIDELQKRKRSATK